MFRNNDGFVKGKAELLKDAATGRNLSRQHYVMPKSKRNKK
jgi:hypothetical protein